LPLLVTALMTSPCLGEEKAFPVIHVAEAVRNLPVAFEGQTISATFTLENQGGAELQILKVTPS